MNVTQYMDDAVREAAIETALAGEGLEPEQRAALVDELAEIRNRNGWEPYATGNTCGTGSAATGSTERDRAESAS